MHKINFDAISKGLSAFLECSVRCHETGEHVEELLTAPKPPKKAHAVLWQDDWWRGVELAMQCAERAFAVEPDVDRGTLLTLVLGRREGRKEKPLSAQQEEVLSVLEHLFSNVDETGDPDVTMRITRSGLHWVPSKTKGRRFEDAPAFKMRAADVEEATMAWEES